MSQIFASLRRPKATGLTILSLLVLYGFGLFDHDLWTPDEPRVAAVGKSVADGEWIIPLLNDRPFVEQPPLFAWCVGSIYRIFGVERAERARILSALFGVGTLVVTGLLSAHLCRGPRSARVGLLSAASLALSVEFFTTAHRLVVDGALTFLTTSAALAAWACAEASTRWRRWMAAFLCGLTISLAFLTKGLIGIAAPTLFVVAVFLHRRDAIRLVTLPLIVMTTALFAVVVGSWFYLAWTELGGDAFRLIFIDNTLERIWSTQKGRSHVRPFHYYIVHFPVHFLPATLLLPGALMFAGRRSPGASGKSSAEPQHSGKNDKGDLQGGARIALTWFIAGFVLLSLASTKRAIYLLPFFPGAAIACGAWLDQVVSGEERSRYGKMIAPLLAICLAAAAIAVPPVARLLPEFPLSLAVITTAVGIVFAALVVHFRAQPTRFLCAFLVGFTLVVVGAERTLLGYDRIKSLRDVTRTIAATIPPPAAIYLFDPDETTEGLFPLYADRNAVSLFTATELKDAAQRDSAAGGGIYVVAIDKAYRRRQRRRDVVRDLGGELLFEDVRQESRAIRLFRMPTP